MLQVLLQKVQLTEVIPEQVQKTRVLQVLFQMQVQKVEEAQAQKAQLQKAQAQKAQLQKAQLQKVKA